MAKGVDYMGLGMVANARCPTACIIWLTLKYEALIVEFDS